jgi:FAD/FMN-containing dehydrogenase
VPEDALRQFRSNLAESFGPGEPGYDAACQIWNAMIVRRPALVVRCRHTADVVACVRFANEHRLVFGVRGGGHNIGGRALVEGGLLIDLSHLRAVAVDQATGEVTVEPGARLGDLDRATVPHGVVVPSGIVSATGVAGLTLGGGFGWLSRRWGLTCDHLVGAEVVTADGGHLTVDREQHPELLWALRGGGGGFAIVTSFRFEGRRMQPTVLAGPVFHAPEATAETVARFRELSAAAGAQVGSMLKLGAAPSAPFLPAAVHGQAQATIILCHSGAEQEHAEQELAAWRGGPTIEGRVLADLVQPRTFDSFQAMFDAGEPDGRRNYWKSEYVTELDDHMLATLLASHAELPSPSANIKVFSLGGAVASVPATSSAAAHRDARYIVVFATSWADEGGDAANVDWVRRGWAAIHARSGRGGYVNFLTDDHSAEEASASHAGTDTARLAAIKREWDPEARLGRLA